MNCLLGYRLLRPLGAHYTAMQSLIWLLCFPLSCQRSRCASCWGCADAPHSLDLLDLLLIDCTVRTLAPPHLSVDEHSMLSCWSSCVELRRNRSPSPMLLCYFLCCWSSRSLVASLCYRLWPFTRRRLVIDRINQHNVGWTFNSESCVD